MKRYLSVVLLGLALVGCKTTGGWQTVSGKFLSTTAVAVDSSMQAYATWAVMNHLGTNDLAKVRTVYADYQITMMVATNAYVLAVKAGDLSLFTGPSNNLFNAKSAVTSVTAH
jgi:hypothetical protein